MGASWLQQVGVFDLETTGVDVETARIVSAHVGVLDDDGNVVEQLEWLADPGVEIPEGAAQVHGITTERARAEGRAAAEVVAEIIDALRGLFARGVPVTVYNAPYDFTVLDREARRHGIEPLAITGTVIDPLVIDKQVDRYRRGKRTLEAASAVYGIELLRAHDAGSDAIAAGRVALAIIRAHAALLPADPAELHRSQAMWSSEQAANFQAYMRRVRDPEFVARGSWPSY
ncbi:3'-5' exonuclease [Ruicaihuangia caeni]|uniref:3'-5' exonuclease n=1 Tax=Ruicaihuangia caeni TaxID=3042517 RepID=UPI0033906A76